MLSGITWFACPLYSVLAKGTNLFILFFYSPVLLVYMLHILIFLSFFLLLLHSLPGGALANGQTIWLCDAQYADSKVFSRSLLAKVSFPWQIALSNLSLFQPAI
jgi:hypothetical protein